MKIIFSMANNKQTNKRTNKPDVLTYLLYQSNNNTILFLTDVDLSIGAENSFGKIRERGKVAIVVEFPFNETLVSSEEVEEVYNVLLGFQCFFVKLLTREDRLEPSEKQRKQVSLLIFRLHVFESNSFKQIILVRILQRSWFNRIIPASLHNIMRDSSQE